MSRKIFLSYATQDKALAQSLKSDIGKLLSGDPNEALDVFDVGTDIAVGDDIRKSIREAIDAASTVVVISSEEADASPWVNYEVGLADAMGKHLVVVARNGIKDTDLLRRLIHTAKIIKIENG